MSNGESGRRSGVVGSEVGREFLKAKFSYNFTLGKHLALLSLRIPNAGHQFNRIVCTLSSRVHYWFISHLDATFIRSKEGINESIGGRKSRLLREGESLAFGRLFLGDPLSFLLLQFQ